MVFLIKSGKIGTRWPACVHDKKYRRNGLRFETLPSSPNHTDREIDVRSKYRLADIE